MTDEPQCEVCGKPGGMWSLNPPHRILCDKHDRERSSVMQEAKDVAQEVWDDSHPNKFPKETK